MESAPDNAFVLDVMLSVLINKGAIARRESTQEIEVLLDRLEKVGNDEGHSFYMTRRAEYEWKKTTRARGVPANRRGGKEDGLDAIRVHLLRGHIYLDTGNKAVAIEEINLVKAKLGKFSRADGRTNLRELLELEALYNVSIGSFGVRRKTYTETARCFRAAKPVS